MIIAYSLPDEFYQLNTAVVILPPVQQYSIDYAGFNDSFRTPGYMLTKGRIIEVQLEKSALVPALDLLAFLVASPPFVALGQKTPRSVTIANLGDQDDVGVQLKKRFAFFESRLDARRFERLGQARRPLVPDQAIPFG